MDFSDYRPAPQVLDHLKQVDLVAVVGPTGVGKTTLIRAAMEYEPTIHIVRNNTSRAPRSEEYKGSDYRFCTRQEMLVRMKRGEFVQVAPSVLGDLYATAPQDYSTEGFAAMAILAEAIPAFRTLPFRSLRTIFILPPDLPTWQGRMASHGFTPAKLAKRLNEAKHSLEFALYDESTEFVINDNLDQAAQHFVSLLHSAVRAAPASARLLAQQLLAGFRSYK